MKLDVRFSENNMSMNVVLPNEPKSFDPNMGEFVVVHNGQNGATFYPAVSEDGIISWTNDRELKNPPSVNIKGVKGDKGDPGEQGLPGIQGPQGIPGDKGDTGDRGEKGDPGKDGVNGTNGKDGTNGTNGKDGTPCTHRWSGTTLYVTSASGTTSANLKGDKGDTGADGKDGINGKDGVDGKDGADGRTPVKGTDYFTEADKAEMVSAVISALPKYNGEVVAV